MAGGAVAGRAAAGGGTLSQKPFPLSYPANQQTQNGAQCLGAFRTQIPQLEGSPLGELAD